MRSFKSLVLAAYLLATASARQLSYEKIAGYEPSSSMTDYNAIDLDFKAIETQTGIGSKDSFVAAEKIYEFGGNSLSYAELTIPDGLPFSVSKGTAITSKASSGSNTYGIAYSDADSGSKTLYVAYKTTEFQDSYLTCQVGGLVTPNLEGCFNETGKLSIADSTQTATYTYDPLTDNKNGRTLKSLSTEADVTMRESSGEYQDDFQLFVDYYGTPFYADEFITAALQGTQTNFKNGNADFSIYGSDYEPRAEAVEKGIQYMSTAMYAIHQIEEAQEYCGKTCTTDCEDGHPLDKAVAFYVGSLQGLDGSGDGVLFYSLANKRCINFKTCGESGTELTGNSKVNIIVMKNFEQMKSNLAAGNCEAADENEETIIKHMVIPLIQGTLRYARETESNPDAGDKGEAEGASFAASVLPFINKCDPDAATTIYNNMKTGQQKSAKLSVVKEAFEKTYRCLGISCADVGGIWDDANDKYYDGAEPCKSSASLNGISILASIISIAALAFSIF